MFSLPSMTTLTPSGNRGIEGGSGERGRGERDGKEGVEDIREDTCSSERDTRQAVVTR